MVDFIFGRMENLLLLTGLLTLSVQFLFSQNVTVYDENFDGQSHTFNMTGSTSGLGTPSAPGLRWHVNDEYQGGSGSYVCPPPFTLDYTAPNIPDQPAGVVFSPNSSYLHILIDELEEDGIENAGLIEFAGSCALQEQVFVKMQDFVSTENLQDVILSFYWLCGGGPDTRGSVYYKTIGGNWTQITSPMTYYFNQTNWIQESIQLPAFENQEGIKFGFLFEHGFQINSKRGFSIDDVRISATDVTVGAQENELQKVGLFPNPTTGFLTVSGSDVLNYNVYNVLGEKLREGSTSRVDVSELNAGIYLLEIITESGSALKRFQKL